MLANRMRQAGGGEGGTTFTFTVSAETQNYNLATDLLNRGWDGVDASKLVVRGTYNGLIGSTNPNSPAFDIPASLAGADIQLTFAAEIQGAGGTPGAGGANSGGNGRNGGRGGTAFRTAVPVKVSNGSSWKGGGGGGPGGGGATGGNDDGGGPEDPSICQDQRNQSGGPGGRGQGYDGASSSGSPGGTSTVGACTTRGGTGATGAAFGLASSAAEAGSATGCTCEVVTGASGVPGPAGYSVEGFSNITFSPQGTLTGPTTG